MPRTAVGLFRNRSVVDEVVHEIESIGFPRNDVRTLGEPLDFGVTGVMSIPRIDFEVDLFRELTKMGAAKTAVQAYVEGLRKGGVLVFATGPDEQVDEAAEIMNRHGAVETEEDQGLEPHFHAAVREAATPFHNSPVQVGRTRNSAGGASLFVW
ncbi:MAG TPA: hypothetical protein VME17_01575 [Bryobacteraceae bacterium]|nr:hypothetical protein [Bryobacteraceae bacterium]